LEHARRALGARRDLARRRRRVAAAPVAHARRAVRRRVDRGGRGMTAATGERPLRIGELAERTGGTPRAVRYYEEIGLLSRGDRAKGSHRVYDETDVDRVRELTRLRDLLNVSLEELKQLLEAEEARATLRRRFHETESSAERLRILDAALPHVE